jgi:gas vesicle protein
MLGSDANTGFDSDSDSTGSDDSTADTAKGEGRQVAQEAKEGGQRVAGVAKEEAGKVASTVGDQVKTLFSQGRSELSDQAGTQQQRLAEGLMSLSAELDSMAQDSEQSGPATDLARQASQRSQDFAGWLEANEPGAALDEVKRFAQRRPGTFILLAAGVGLLAGRLTRGLTGGSDDAPDASGQGHPVGGDPYRQGGTGPVAPAFPEAPAPATGPMAPAPVPPVGTQPGFVDDGVDYPDTAVGYPDEEFAPGRQTQDGPGPR